MFPLEFRAEVNHEETRVMGLSSSEDRMIIAGVVLAWYRTVTDRRSDGQTESIIAKTALCIASYADALSKTGELCKTAGLVRSIDGILVNSWWKLQYWVGLHQIPQQYQIPKKKTIINDKQRDTSNLSSTMHNIRFIHCKLYLRPEDACLPFLALTVKLLLASSPAGIRPSYSQNKNAKVSVRQPWYTGILKMRSST